MERTGLSLSGMTGICEIVTCQRLKAEENRNKVLKVGLTLKD